MEPYAGGALLFQSGNDLKLSSATGKDTDQCSKTSETERDPDLPCTGSGTWSRTPEALYYFNPETISNYRQRQERILTNVLRRLKPNGIQIFHARVVAHGAVRRRRFIISIRKRSQIIVSDRKGY